MAVLKFPIDKANGLQELILAQKIERINRWQPPERKDEKYFFVWNDGVYDPNKLIEFLDENGYDYRGSVPEGKGYFVLLVCDEALAHFRLAGADQLPEARLAC